MPFPGQRYETFARNSFLPGLFFFLAALFLYTGYADFPSYYHPDEPSKVEQLLHHYRNFKHPPLMLNTAGALAWILQTPADSESLVCLGRFLSAVYAAGTVALLTFLATSLRNLLTGILTGALCLASPQLYEAAHYFKEDSLFLFCTALLTVLLVFYSSLPLRQPPQKISPAWPSLIGFGSALLASSRYFALLLLPVIFFGLQFHRNRRLALAFVGSLVLTILVIHLPSLRWLPFFAEEFPLETHYMLAGHYGVGLPVPHAAYFKYWTGATYPALWLFLAVFFGVQLRERKRGVGIALVIIMFYWFTLSCLPKYSERYLLPVLLGSLFFAAWGAGNFVQLLENFRQGRVSALRLTAWAIASVLLLWPAVSGLQQMQSAFRQDDRQALAEWIQGHLPPGSKIAQDDVLHLEGLSGSVYSFLSSEYVPDLGTIRDLQEKGLRYVAISRRTHYPYTARGLAAAQPDEKQFTERRDFYLGLLTPGKNSLAGTGPRSKNSASRHHAGRHSGNRSIRWIHQVKSWCLTPSLQSSQRRVRQFKRRLPRPLGNLPCISYLICRIGPSSRQPFA